MPTVLVDVQEDAFEFDKEYKDYRIDNPLLRQHKEWDNDAMTGENGSVLLLPSQYNRYARLPAAGLILHAHHLFSLVACRVQLKHWIQLLCAHANGSRALSEHLPVKAVCYPHSNQGLPYIQQ